MSGSIKVLVPVSHSFWASSRLGAVVFHMQRGAAGRGWWGVGGWGRVVVV